MRTEAIPATAEDRSACVGGGARANESRPVDPAALRTILVVGMALAVAACLFEIIALDGEPLTSIVLLRTVAVCCPIGIALVATFLASMRSRFCEILTATLLLANAGSAAIAASLLAGGAPMTILEPVVLTFAIYLLSGLPIKYSMIAGAPAIFVFLVFGAVLSVPIEQLLYAGLFLFLANAMGLFICRGREASNRQLEQATEELTGLINTDRLTGIYNRHMFDDHVTRVWRQSRRERHNLSLLIVDIDYMRLFNKRYGHPEGDRCIRRIGEALKKSVRRPLDFVARYDGSRFALVLYDPPTTYIRKLVVSIQTAIAGLHIPNESSPIGPRVTVSIGAVVLGPDTAKSLEGAVQFAEEALSASKLRGRDRAVVFQSSDLERSTMFEGSAISARS